MDWLDGILKDIDGAEELSKKISKELPKHFKPAGVFNEKNDKLKEAEELAAKFKAELEAKNNGEKSAEEKLNEALALMKKQGEDFETYKTTVEQSKVTETRAKQLEKALRDANINTDALDFVVKTADMEKAFGEDGLNMDYVEGIKTAKPSLFGKENVNSKRTDDNNSKNDEGFYTTEEIKAMSQDEVNKNLPKVLESLEHNKE